jgi:hypothetical protein
MRRCGSAMMQKVTVNTYSIHENPPARKPVLDLMQERLQFRPSMCRTSADAGHDLRTAVTTNTAPASRLAASK